MLFKLAVFFDEELGIAVVKSLKAASKSKSVTAF